MPSLPGKSNYEKTLHSMKYSQTMLYVRLRVINQPVQCKVLTSEDYI